MGELNKAVLVLAMVAIILPLFNMVTIIYKLGEFASLTGRATTAEGTANLTVEESASINFSVSSIDWGSGRVHGDGFAILSTADGNVSGGNWTNVSEGLLLVNTGNVNVSLLLSSGSADTSADSLIGGTNPEYKWNFTNNETEGCYTNFTNITLGTLFDANTSMMVCNPLEYQDAFDELKIHFYLQIPTDSITGVRTDTITATATAV